MLVSAIQQRESDISIHMSPSWASLPTLSHLIPLGFHRVQGRMSSQATEWTNLQGRKRDAEEEKRLWGHGRRGWNQLREWHWKHTLPEVKQIVWSCCVIQDAGLFVFFFFDLCWQSNFIFKIIYLFFNIKVFIFIAKNCYCKRLPVTVQNKFILKKKDSRLT